MYYFDIIDILKSTEDKLSSYEIYIKLIKKNGVAKLHRIRQVLFKMYLNDDKIHREERIITRKPYTREYVFFYNLR